MNKFKQIFAIVTFPIVLIAIIATPVVAIGSNIISYLDKTSGKNDQFGIDEFVDLVTYVIETYKELFK